jgi:hypothetical protein
LALILRGGDADGHEKGVITWKLIRQRKYVLRWGDDIGEKKVGRDFSFH